LRGLRRDGGGGGGGCRVVVEGETAREEARLLATMALARESTVTEEFMETAEVEVRRRFWLWRVARKEGWKSDAETKESSDEASSSSFSVSGWG
jgi:hypothetical protein